MSLQRNPARRSRAISHALRSSARIRARMLDTRLCTIYALTYKGRKKR